MFFLSDELSFACASPSSWIACQGGPLWTGSHVYEGSALFIPEVLGSPWWMGDMATVSLFPLWGNWKPFRLWHVSGGEGTWRGREGMGGNLPQVQARRRYIVCREFKSNNKTH